MRQVLDQDALQQLVALIHARVQVARAFERGAGAFELAPDELGAPEEYERAYEESQIYKEGKYVLEKALLCEERRAR